MKTFSIPGGLAGPPSACSAAPDRLDVFAVMPGGIVSRWSWDGTGWTQSDLPPLGGVIPAEGVCAVSSGPGLVEVFAVERTARRAVWWRGDLTTGLWRNGGPLPQGANIPEVPVAAVCASPDYIDVFAVDGNTPRWWHWEGSGWNDMGPLPGGNLPAERVAAVSPGSRRLDVFAVGTDTHLYHWLNFGDGRWTMYDLGGNMPSEGVSAVSWGPNRIDVFAVGLNTHLQHWSSDGTSFAGPEDLGGSLVAGTVSAVSYAPHRLDVFAISGDQRLAHWQWDGQRWSDPDYRGDNIPAGDVSAVARQPHRLDVFVTGRGNTLRQWPGGGLENVRNEDWRNWPTNHEKLAPPGILRPDSLEELVNIVKEAEQANLGVRAVGTTWSNSDVAVSKGYVVETDGLSAVLTGVLSTSLTSAGAALQLVHVEGGIKLDALVRFLADGKRKLELMTLGGSTGQSLAGAVSTCTHGMDVDRGPLPDMVRAIHLVGPGGVQHWIEPSSPITEKTALISALGLTDENIHYDDDWFYSVLVSMGSMGIIYSLIIEVEARYALKETRANIDWSDIRARLAGGAGNPLADNTNRGVQVAFNPYPRGDGTLVWNGTRVCYLTTRKAAPEAEVQVPPTDDTWQGDLLTPLLVAEFIADRSSIDDRINDVTSEKQKQKNITLWAHDLAGGRKTPSSKGLTVEFMFDASTTRYLDFVDAALEIISKAYHVEKPKNLAYVGWISMRFQGNSRAYLSPQHGAKRTCSIEFAAASLLSLRVGGELIPWPDTRILLDRIEAKGREFGGIQHWGLNNNLDASDVALAYPRLDTWRRVRWELTNGGTITTFDSEFTRRCGLSAPPNTGFLLLPGLGKDIGVGADGSVWLIGPNPVGAASDFGVYKWNRTNWDAVDGGGVRIAVGPDGAPWMVNSVGQIFHRQGNSWAALPGSGKDIGVGADGSVWKIGTNQVGASDFDVSKWNGADWDRVDGGGVRIAVGPDGTPWIVNSLGQIFHRQSPPVVLATDRPSGLRVGSVLVGSGVRPGNPWGGPLPGLGKDIGVGADGSVWLIGTNPVGAGSDFGVYKWNGTNWDGLANSGGVCIAGGPGGLAWLVNSVGQIFRRS